MIFRVDRIDASTIGNLLLWGSAGCCIVTLPHYNDLRNTTDITCKYVKMMMMITFIYIYIYSYTCISKIDHLKGMMMIFRSWPIGELIFIENPGLELLSVQWLPSSGQHIVMLTSDNCLRLFDILNKQLRPLVTVTISVDFSKHRFIFTHPMVFFLIN